MEKDDINVSYEVLEMPQKTGFLGLKLTPAKVRVSVELPDEPVAAPAAPVEEPTPVVEEKAAPVAAEPVVEETALKLPLLWKSLLLPLRKLSLPKSRLLPPQRAKRWKSPSTSRRTPRSRPLWTT